jgi:hypothetical protein
MTTYLLIALGISVSYALYQKARTYKLKSEINQLKIENDSIMTSNNNLKFSLSLAEDAKIALQNELLDLEKIRNIIEKIPEKGKDNYTKVNI